MRLTTARRTFVGKRSQPQGTHDEPDLMRYYMDQIGATPLLTAQEEVNLAKRIEAGVYAAELLRQAAETDWSPDGRLLGELRAVERDGRRAKEHMTRANLRLVISVAKKHTRRGVPFHDVVQEGNLGLIRAVEKFDYAKGYKFSTYAVWWIRQAIERGIAEQARPIRLPMHVVEAVSKIDRSDRELQRLLEREPTIEELAEAAKMPAHRVAELRRASREVVSLDTPLGAEGDSRLGDLLRDDNEFSAAEMIEHRAMAEELRAVVDELPEREALIMTLRYGLVDGRPRTLQEVASHLNLTRERIRQLEKDALRQLREPRRHERLLAWAS
ncbi:sigma-70 family RNA polymerase sigma factor [Goodfellowiella coeruleoviolacea]|uniref:RNA polymerase sigma factor n=1 Tax=Goodfellowiella coeruleoviolacea TaxID=334858 RepID=A0AAE3GI39_9PSEU|nr:sigma-70 family RNA polymerase sigma factor [Goodfellowiella coeruleoviolacea]MCP2166558.1 RNA polymerase primary sigma factor [Goodfellowiella coeruleoviolacea]